MGKINVITGKELITGTNPDETALLTQIEMKKYFNPTHGKYLAKESKKFLAKYDEVIKPTSIDSDELLVWLLAEKEITEDDYNAKTDVEKKTLIAEYIKNGGVTTTDFADNMKAKFSNEEVKEGELTTLEKIEAFETLVRTFVTGVEDMCSIANEDIISDLFKTITGV